jgi:hypothetical protein
MYASTEHKQPRCNGKHVLEKKPSGHWDTFNSLEHHLYVNICKCFVFLLIQIHTEST